MSQQFCTFYIDELFFGVDVREVQEVLRFQSMTPVPLAPKVIKGLINLRGQIVTALDLRTRLGLTDRGSEAHPMNVVISTDDGPISLLVDTIGDVIEVDEAAFEAPPSTVLAKMRELIQGVCKLQGQLMLVLDVDRVVRTEAEE